MSNGLRGTSAFDAGTLPLAAPSAPSVWGCPRLTKPTTASRFDFHLVPAGTGALAACFDFRALRHGGGNGVGQLTREPVYDVIHRTAPSRLGILRSLPELRQPAGTVGSG